MKEKAVHLVAGESKDITPESWKSNPSPENAEFSRKERDESY